MVVIDVGPGEQHHRLKVIWLVGLSRGVEEKKD